jgi:hypothetical protein
MIIQWEDIRWDADDAGTSWATLVDEDDNSLTLENRAGKIIFHTLGSPRFDASTVLDIASVCVILSKNALNQANRARARGVATRRAQPRATGTLIPEPRRAPAAEPHDTKPKARRLAQADCLSRPFAW